MSAGQDFAKKIGPLGGAFFLLLFVLFLIYCFTAKPNPLAGYEAPHDSTYYAQNETTLSELKAELEANVLPKLEGEESCTVKDGKLVLVINSADFKTSRSAILRYYDDSLFEFVSNDT